MEISIRHIAKSFRRKEVLRDVELTVGEGNCVGILGGNGSGKSTLLTILAGIQRADKGEFLCDGTDLLRDGKRRGELVGFVPQGTPLIEELNAWDNLLLWYDRAELRRSLQDGVLHMLGVQEFLSTTVSKMSGGMKKRLSIGCAMHRDQPVLLLDEPTAALDLVCKQNIAEYLREHRKKGGILLLTTHDAAELELCDELYILKDGVLTRFDYDGDIRSLTERL